jgi:hemoglobin/transferrin/lactoferrin receptor protein
MAKAELHERAGRCCKAAIAAGVSLVAIMAAGAVAQERPPAVPPPVSPPPGTQLDEITVTTERGPSTVYNSPSTVTVKTDKDIEKEQAHRPADLVRAEPGVSVGNQPTRGGATNYVIRGIGENRVRLQVDGYRIPDAPGTLIGAGTYTRDVVDFDTLKRVEIIRGPASALYGSDAIGGVVSFVTKDPGDYLKIFGKDTYFGLKVGFDSADRSLSTTATGAIRIGPWEALALFTRRDGREVTPNGFKPPNPQSYFVNSGLAKLIYDTPDAGRWRLTVEGVQKGVGTNIRTDIGVANFSRSFDSRGRDDQWRGRVSLDWTKDLNTAFADQMIAKVYWTGVDRQEETRLFRAPALGGPLPTLPSRYRYTTSDYVQNIYGAEVQFTADRALGDWRHRITYGASYDVTTTSRLRDRYERNLVTNAITNVVAGEAYPNKLFPDTTTTQAAFFIQDVAQWGRLRLIPAIRFDYYQLNPKPDADFARGNIRNFQINKQTEIAVSPKFGATYDLTDELRVFGQYARGFRAPPYDNANFAFSNAVQGYEILPNGNLKPEKSDSFEAGLRGRFADGSSFQVSGFYNLYKDFIDTQVVGISPAGLTQFQYVNLARVRIYGFEAKGEYRITPEWSLSGAVAYARGENTDTKRPIDSVDPLTATASLRYQNSAGWSLEGRVRAAAGKTRVSDPTLMTTGAYAVFDLLGSYEVSKNFIVNAGVFNIADKRYFSAQDVTGLQKTNANVELFRSTGRTFAMNATVRW